MADDVTTPPVNQALLPSGVAFSRLRGLVMTKERFLAELVARRGATAVPRRDSGAPAGTPGILTALYRPRQSDPDYVLVHQITTRKTVKLLFVPLSVLPPDLPSREFVMRSGVNETVHLESEVYGKLGGRLLNPLGPVTSVLAVECYTLAKSYPDFWTTERIAEDRAGSSQLKMDQAYVRDLETFFRQPVFNSALALNDYGVSKRFFLAAADDGLMLLPTAGPAAGGARALFATGALGIRAHDLMTATDANQRFDAMLGISFDLIELATTIRGLRARTGFRPPRASETTAPALRRYAREVADPRLVLEPLRRERLPELATATTRCWADRLDVSAANGITPRQLLSRVIADPTIVPVAVQQPLLNAGFMRMLNWPEVPIVFDPQIVGTGTLASNGGAFMRIHPGLADPRAGAVIVPLVYHEYVHSYLALAAERGEVEARRLVCFIVDDAEGNLLGREAFVAANNARRIDEECLAWRKTAIVVRDLSNAGVRLEENYLRQHLDILEIIRNRSVDPVVRNQLLRETLSYYSYSDYFERVYDIRASRGLPLGNLRNRIDHEVMIGSGPSP